LRRGTARSSATPLDDALACLYRRNLHTIRLGLDTVAALLERMGRPQDAFLAIHVAGTNGKGSVCAMIESILRAAGFRTGLYTSPHLVRFHERIRVGGAAISDADLAGLIEDVDARAIAAAQMPGARDVTFFEFTTALAFEHFRRAGVQIAVIETGMGGRLDATNVVDPAIAVITSIGLDHQAFLGPDEASIAAEKAGIVKPGRPVICGELGGEAMEVIARTARERGASLVSAAEVAAVRSRDAGWSGQRLSIELPSGPLAPVVLPLLGDHQARNAAVAAAAVETLRATYGLPVPDEAMVRGFGAVTWPARMQVLAEDPPTLLDGAHNPQAARALVQALKARNGKRPVAFVTAFLADKDAAGFLSVLAPQAGPLFAVPLETERARPASEVAALARAAGFRAEEARLPEALRAAADWAKAENSAVCICGSLYLAGAVLAHLNRPV
jgi:dihydrofolate synthase/folylpolyglutamate synthase